jgi:hypothetical protein
MILFSLFLHLGIRVGLTALELRSGFSVESGRTHTYHGVKTVSNPSYVVKGVPIKLWLSLKENLTDI